jgi:hypothetical protein
MKHMVSTNIQGLGLSDELLRHLRAEMCGVYEQGEKQNFSRRQPRGGDWVCRQRRLRRSMEITLP